MSTDNPVIVATYVGKSDGKYLFRYGDSEGLIAVCGDVCVCGYMPSVGRKAKLEYIADGWRVVGYV